MQTGVNSLEERHSNNGRVARVQLAEHPWLAEQQSSCSWGVGETRVIMAGLWMPVHSQKKF